MTDGQKNLLAIVAIALAALWFGVLHRPGTYKGVSAEWCANRGGEFAPSWSFTNAFGITSSGPSICEVGLF